MTKKYEKEFKEYCDNLLKQLKDGGMSKLSIHKAKTLYENDKQAYLDFKEIYENKDEEEEIQIVFKPEGVK